MDTLLTEIIRFFCGLRRYSGLPGGSAGFLNYVSTIEAPERGATSSFRLQKSIHERLQGLCFYSARNASIGSVKAAFLAGRNDAVAATAISSMATPIKVIGSNVLTLNNKLRMARAQSGARQIPSTTPAPAKTSPSFTIKPSRF